MIKQADWVKIRIENFVRNYFFDENNDSDSDITSHQSDLPCESFKQQRTSENGIDMLFKAKQKIDERARVESLNGSNSIRHFTPNKPSLREFSISENPYFPTMTGAFKNTGVHQKTETPTRLVGNEGTEEVVPNFIDQLLRHKSKTRSNSCDIASLNPILSQGFPEPSKTVENILTEYLISTPACLDEFYKVMGELYVSEILKYRTDIQSPVQLMKELLLGRFNTNGSELENPNIVNAMMAQATRDNETHCTPHGLDSNRPGVISNNGHPNRDSASLQRGADYPILHDENMVDENQNQDTLMFSNDPALLNERQVVHSQRKRDLKAEMKVRDSANSVAELDTQMKINDPNTLISNTIEAKSELKKHKSPSKEPKVAKEKPSQVKRAPKKFNQRVFLSKISNKKKQTASNGQIMCDGTEIEEFCKSLIEETVNDII